MKFWTWAHKISIDHQIKFPKDPYINANAQVVKVRSRFIAIMDVYNLYARIGEQIFMKRDMSSEISGGTFEWTRPPDWPTQIPQLR